MRVILLLLLLLLLVVLMIVPEGTEEGVGGDVDLSSS